MFALPSVRAIVSSNGCVIPGSPAVPRKSAYSDQPNAASVPSDTSVSMVAAPWRALAHAARWKGAPPHTTTGAARVSDSHCQYWNCSAGIIAIATTGTASAVETSSRVRSERTPSSTGSASTLARGRLGVRGCRRLGQCCGVAGLLDRGDQVVGGDAVGETDLRLLGGVVDGRAH